MSHVTSVASPAGTMVKTTMLCASKGRVKSSLIATVPGAEASTISMRPAPTSLFPSQA